MNTAIRSGFVGAGAAVAVIVAGAAPVEADNIVLRSHTSIVMLSSATAGGGSVWFGLTNGGVIEMDPASGESSIYTVTSHGLPRLQVADVAVDTDGGVWAATFAGLAHRPAGAAPDERWMVFTTGNSPLASNAILAVEADPAGGVWIGTFDEGLYRVEEGVFTQFHPSNSPISDTLVSSIVVDGLGDVWLGTFSGGVDRFDGTTWTNFNGANTGTPPGLCLPSIPPEEMGLISSFVLVLGQAEDGAMWFANVDDGFCALRGVTRFDGKSWATYTVLNSNLGTDQIVRLTRDETGRPALISMFGEDLNVFTGAGFEPMSVPGGALSAALVGDDIWFGTAQTGAVRLREGAFEEFIPNGLRDTLAQDIAFRVVDEEARGGGGVEAWVGTRFGAERLIDGVWSALTPDNSPLAFGDVSAIAVDVDGALWFGGATGGSGVQRLANGVWTHFVSGPGIDLINGAIADIAVDPATGEKWISDRFSPGVVRFDNATWTTFRPADGAPNSSVRQIVIGPGGVKWFASSSGVGRFDGTTWSVFTTAHGLPSNLVRAVAIDPDGDVWAATTAGLARFDGGVWVPAAPLPGNTPTTLVFDGDGRPWTAPLTSFGVTALIGPNWRLFGIEEGVTGAQAVSSALSPDGEVWMGTDLGITIFDVTGGGCAADLDGDGQAGASDLAALLGAWGAINSPADLDFDGVVGSGDLSQLLGAWGPCP